MTGARERDFFDRARAWAAVVMIAAAAAAIVGSTLDWVTISVRPELREDVSFGANQEQVEAPQVTRPFTGLEAHDGWWSLAGGVVLLLAALALLLTGRGSMGWVGMLGSVVVGAVAIADYRGIGDLSSSISVRMDIVGGAEPAAGITLVVAGAIGGLVGSVAGIAASPHRAGVGSEGGNNR
jgi:hypothetical protein